MAQPLGYSVEQVRRMSWYDLACVIDGFARANKVDRSAPPTDAEDAALRAKYG